MAGTCNQSVPDMAIDEACDLPKKKSPPVN